MRTLYVDRRDARLGYRDGAVEVRPPDGRAFTVPLSGLERVVVGASATLSTGLLSQCWSRDVGVLVLSGRRAEPTARFLGVPHGDARIRIAQAHAARDRRLAGALAAEVARAKIAGQLQTLRKLRPSRRGAVNGGRKSRHDGGASGLSDAEHRAPSPAVDDAVEFAYSPSPQRSNQKEPP